MRCCSARRTWTGWIFAVLTSSSPDLVTLPWVYFGVVRHEDCMFRYAQDAVHGPQQEQICRFQSPSFLLSQLGCSSNQNVKSSCWLWIRRKFPNRCFFDPGIKDGKTPASLKRGETNLWETVCVFRVPGFMPSIQPASCFRILKTSFIVYASICTHFDFSQYYVSKQHNQKNITLH